MSAPKVLPLLVLLFATMATADHQTRVLWPVYLPRTPFWRYALPVDTAGSGNVELDQAYSKYLAGDELSSRAHLYRARAALTQSHSSGLALRLASLECLLDLGAISNEPLLLKGESPQLERLNLDILRSLAGAEDQQDKSNDWLLSARWKKYGGDADNQAAAGWTTLFEAYQLYRSGAETEAESAWKRLAESRSTDRLLAALAWLGVAQIQAGLTLEAQDDPPRRAEAARTALAAITHARQAFRDISHDLGVAQAALFAAEIQFLAGNVSAAEKELQVARLLFEAAHNDEGIVAVHCIGALGEAKAGNAEIAARDVKNAEEATGERRVTEAQIAQLATFAERLPELVGFPDARPPELKLVDAREFQRWALSTGDLLLQLISLQMLSSVLQGSGDTAQALLYKAMLADAESRYRSGVPLRVRVGRAAFLDYDFLHRTGLVERGSLRTFTYDFSRAADIYLAAQKGMRDAALDKVIGVDRAESEETFALYSRKLREIATRADGGRLGFQTKLAAGDRQGAAESLVQLFSGCHDMHEFLNQNEGNVEADSLTEEATSEYTERQKTYEIKTEITTALQVHSLQRTKLEMLQDRTYLDMERDVLIGVVLADESYVRRGVADLLSFYELYRKDISAPDLLDEPFVFSHHGSPNISLPTQKHAREALLREAMDDFRLRYRSELVRQALEPQAVSEGFVNLVLRQGLNQEPREFFEKNFQEVADYSGVQSHKVTTREDGGKLFINIKHAHTAVFEPAQNSVFLVLPAFTSGVDVLRRVQAIYASWDQQAVYASQPRFNELLKSTYRDDLAHRVALDMLGMTAEQLGDRVFTPVLDAGQIALSVQRSGDFLAQLGVRPFAELQREVQSDPQVRLMASKLAELDPDEMDKAEEEISGYMGGILSGMFELQQKDKADEQPSTHDSEEEDTLGLQIVNQFIGVGQVLKYRPLLFLLLGDPNRADAVARSLAERNSVTTAPTELSSGERLSPTTESEAYMRRREERSTELAMYYTAVGAYSKAISELNSLTESFGADALQTAQIEYLLAMCYRRNGEHEMEIGALHHAAGHLEQVRTSLRTRNQATTLQKIRQLVYEEWLTAVFAEKRYADMIPVLRDYKRPTQMPISALAEAQSRDAGLKSLVDETIFLYDVWSREEIWHVEDATMLAALLPQLQSTVDPREAVSSGLNQIANLLVDQLRLAAGPALAETALAAPAGGLTISYFVGSRGLFRVVLDSSGRVSARLVPISETELSGYCEQFRAAIEEHKDFLPAAARLYDILLGEMPQLDSTRRLYISPDGMLNVIPFQALKSSAAGHYLVQDDRTIIYLTGENRPAVTGNLDGGRRILLVGNPDGSLAAAEDEVQRIEKSSGLEATPPLVGPAATLSNLRSQLPGAAFVHFATHARANEAYPNFSYLQLSGWDRLYSVNLGGLLFSGKHIFLSGCETRLGQMLPGDDVYGLATAFLADGASSVISTLWRIENDSSSLFAQRYYQLVEQTHNPPAALAMTEREFLSGKWYVEREGTVTTLDAPVFWAGFNYIAGADSQ